MLDEEARCSEGRSNAGEQPQQEDWWREHHTEKFHYGPRSFVSPSEIGV